MRILFVLLALSLALSVSACGSRVYPKSPVGKVEASKSY